MRIEFDYDFSGDRKISTHYIDTESGKHQQVVVSGLGANPVDVIHLIKQLHSGAIPIEGTGWEEITKHPSYPNQTRLEAVIAEIIRLDDKPSRQILGV